MARVQPDAGDTEQYLTRTVRQLAKLAEQAERDRSWNAAVAAKKEERQVRQLLDQVRELRTQVAEVPSSVDEHRREVRLVVRRMRVAAQAAGSHVAAARLLQLEDEILSRYQAELSKAEADALQAAELRDLTAEIERLRAARQAH